MPKSCGTCLYGDGDDDQSRSCSWFVATQLGRKVKAIGPFWLEVGKNVFPEEGDDCAAYESAD